MDENKPEVRSDIDQIYSAVMADTEALEEAKMTLEVIKGTDPGVYDEMINDTLSLIRRALSTSILGVVDRLVDTDQKPVANASSWFALVMGAAAEIEDASNCLRDEDAKRKAISGAKHYRDAANALYLAPPQREWVGLTDEEIKDFYGDDDNFSMTGRYVIAFARAIEAKLKEKNG